MITHFHTLLETLSQAKKPVTFVQVGAHDGVRHDPINRYIKKYGWSGLLIEPVPRYFEQLKRNYAGQPHLDFENCAIGPKKGMAILYGVSDNAPWWMWQLARTRDSFSKDVLLENAWYMPGLSHHIEGKKVNTNTLPNLMKKHHITHPDIVVIDVEGYDYEVLKQIDFASHKPRCIYFEHRHLVQSDKESAWNLLRKQGYTIEDDIHNTLAYRI